MSVERFYWLGWVYIYEIVVGEGVVVMYDYVVDWDGGLLYDFGKFDLIKWNNIFWIFRWMNDWGFELI